jgi:hypothetical protein
VAPPLSLSMLGDRILVRTHKLLTVNVNSKATCGDSYASLRAYQLDYTREIPASSLQGPSGIVAWKGFWDKG